MKKNQKTKRNYPLNVKPLFFIILITAILTGVFGVTVQAATTEPATEMRGEYKAIHANDSVAGLNELEHVLYNELKTFAVSVTNGDVSSTYFEVEINASDFSWADSALRVMVEEFDFNHIQKCLYCDCPYDMFWFDKTVGQQYDLSVNETPSGEIKSIFLMCLFPVSKDYQPLDATDCYSVSVEAITRAHDAALVAKLIVAEYESKSDWGKLVGYAKEIVELTEYNTRVLNEEDELYGDPFQLLYVFDRNANTNVVCEGYAKAFKYLCDLSSFEKDVQCYTLSGDSHMWNVVDVDGKNYFVDLTAYDTYKCDDCLLVGGTSTDGGKTFTVACKSGHSFTYAYYEWQENMYCDGYLMLSEIGSQQTRVRELLTQLLVAILDCFVRLLTSQ